MTVADASAARARRAVFLAIALAGAAACSPPVPAGVDRFEVAIALSADGVATFEETIVVRPGSTDRLERRIVSRHSDTLEFVDASIDGSPVGPGGVDIEQESPARLVVTWRVDPPAAQPVTLGLRYRAAGALAMFGRTGRFEWPAIPGDRPGPLAEARVRITVPPGVARVGEWGLAQRGWDVTALQDGIAATRTALPAAEPGTVLAEIVVDAGRLPEPRWQHDAELGRQLVPAFISGGLFILTIGLGVIWIIRFEAANRARAAGMSAPEASAAHRRTREGLYVAGIACLIFGAIATVATRILMSRYGPWSMAVPGSILLVALMFVLAGTRPGRAR